MICGNNICNEEITVQRSDFNFRPRDSGDKWEMSNSKIKSVGHVIALFSSLNETRKITQRKLFWTTEITKMVANNAIFLRK